MFNILSSKVKYSGKPFRSLESWVNNQVLPITEEKQEGLKKKIRPKLHRFKPLLKEKVLLGDNSDKAQGQYLALKVLSNSSP